MVDGKTYDDGRFWYRAAGVKIGRCENDCLNEQPVAVFEVTDARGTVCYSRALLEERADNKRLRGADTSMEDDALAALDEFEAALNVENRPRL